MRHVAITFALFVSLIHPAFGQGIDTSPSAQTGRLPFGSYVDGSIDSIGVYNGNVSLDIPLVTLPGRELSTGLRLAYNSQKWQEFSYVGEAGGAYTGGWRLHDFIGEPPAFSWEEVGTCNLPNISVRLIATWVDGSGSKHPFTKTEVQPCTWPINYDFTNRTFDSENGDGAKLYTGNTAKDVTIKFKDGLSVQFFPSGSPKVTTPNGNYLERGTNGLPLQDTLGRSIVFETDFDPANREQQTEDYAYFRKYNVTDANGNQQVYTLNFLDKHRMWNPWEQGYDLLDGILMSIVLPDMRSYSFEYNTDAGYLTKVILPTTGYIRYVYQDDTKHVGEDNVIQRYISYDGTGQGEQLWQYTRSTNAVQRDVTTTTPAGDSVVHRFDDADLNIKLF